MSMNAFQKTGINPSSTAATPGAASSSVIDGLAEFRQLAGMSGFVGGYGASAGMGAAAAAAPIGGYMGAASGIAPVGAAGMPMGMSTGASAMGGRTAEEEQLFFSLLRERSGFSGVSNFYGNPSATGVGANVVPNPTPLLGNIGLGSTAYDLPREPMTAHQPSLSLMRDLQGTANIGGIPPVGMGNFLLEQQRANGFQINPGLHLNPAATTTLDMNFIGRPAAMTAANIMPQPILNLPQNPLEEPDEIEEQEDIPADRKLLETEVAPVQEDLFDDDDDGEGSMDNEDEILDPDPLPTPERKIAAATAKAFPTEKRTKKKGSKNERSMAAFQLYCIDEKERILNDWKSSKSDIIGLENSKKRKRPSNQGMEKLISERWQVLSDDWKKYYQDLADTDVDGQKKGKKNRIIDANAPRRPPTAFLLFSNKRRKALKRSKPDATNADLSRLLSKTWREAPDNIRQKYLDESAEMSAVYKEEMLAYKAREREKAASTGLDQSESNHSGQNSSARSPPRIIRPPDVKEASERESGRKHRKKDPNAPKRPLSAFLAYSNARRKELKRRYPDSTNADLSKMLSKMWKEAPEEFRQKYIDEAARRSSVYKEDMARWKAKQGMTNNL